MQPISTIAIDELRADSYQTFLTAKSIPRYDIRRGESGEWLIDYPSEYAGRFGEEVESKKIAMPLDLPDFLFDRQRVMVEVSWHKKRYALFWDAGLGKTLIFLELARQLTAIGKKCLILSPLNVIAQTIEAADEFYFSEMMLANFHGDIPALNRWRKTKASTVGILNQLIQLRLYPPRWINSTPQAGRHISKHCTHCA